MKLVAISDLHGTLPYNLPKGDTLVIAGDLVPCTGSHHPVAQRKWVDNHLLPYFTSLIKDKIFGDIVFVNGNHCFWGEKLMKDNQEDSFRLSLPEHIHYLRDSEITINDIRFYGTPWTPKFGNWAFMATEEVLHNHFMKIPTGINILISHGPPRGYCDVLLKPIYESQKELGHIGSSALYTHIKRAQPSVAVFGHLHSGNHNMEKLIYNFDEPEKYTKCYNVSILDEQYEPTYIEMLKITI
jgi:Icc-related predicted phosphoesterase